MTTSTQERTHMEVDKADAQKQITVLNADANQKATKIRQDALGEILDYKITKEKETYHNVKDLLGFNKNNVLLDYIYYMNLMRIQKPGTKLLIGMESPIAHLN